MVRSIFITGTDTGVGKTFVTAGLTGTLQEKGINVGIMKPVGSGCVIGEDKTVSEDILYIKEMTGIKDEEELINPYALKAPLSPSLAARMEGINVDFEVIARSYRVLLKRHEMLLVEGVGGLMTPLNDLYVVADLVKYLGLSAILVVGSRLGAINHTLLTLSVTRYMNIEVKGLIINRSCTKDDPSADTLREEIERFTDIPVLVEIPYCKDMDEMKGVLKKSFPFKSLFYRDG